MDGSIPSPHPPRPLSIFVVENHRDTLEYMQMYLEMLGHTVRAARSFAEALASLPQADCDVLLSDIGLPDRDGWELLGCVRGHLPRPIYAVTMSGFGTSADRLKSKEAGYRHHLLKPIDLRQLEAALDEAAGELA